MSEENVEAFRRGIAAWNREDIDATLEVLDPEVEWRPTFQRLLGRDTAVYRGRHGAREFLQDLDETFAELRIEISEIRDLGERIVAIGHARGRGKQSGAEVDSSIGYVVEFKNGKVIRMDDYLDAAEALEAAGLQAMSEENIKVFGTFNEAFNQRDFDDAAQYLDRAVEINPGVMAPDHDSKLLGHDGWKEFIRVAIEAWETATAEPLERSETADGRILSIDLWRLRGRGGIQIERELPTLYTFRDGLIVRIDGFTEKADALEAAGLSE